MGNSKVSEISHHVSTESPRADWRFSYRWGGQLGDLTEYIVYKKNGTVSIYVENDSINIRPEVLEQFREAINAALDWQPE